MVKNAAFVFIKPHAVTDAVKSLVRDDFNAKGFKITAEGEITADQIDKGMLIDQHYYAIASKATLLQPSELNVPAEKFEGQFGISWKQALAEGKCYNAMQACEKLGLDADGLDKLWGKTKKAKKMIKFGGGFYCGEVADGMYVFNGFFMSMRSKFVAPGTSIYYFTIEWDAKSCDWESFRNDVLGPTDPATASTESARGKIYANWQSLGLKAQPDVGDNGVHASASPFEALAERMNWLGADMATDPFGAAMLSAGLSADTIKAWSVDPQVTFGPTGIKQSLFDTFEDTNADYNLALACMVDASGAAESTAAPESNTTSLVVALAAGVAIGYTIARL